MKLFRPKHQDVIEFDSNKSQPISRLIMKDKDGRVIKKNSKNFEEYSYKSLDLKSISYQDLRIGYWSTWQVKCGIAIYTEHLYNAVKHIGGNAFGYSHTMTPIELLQRIDLDKIHVLNIQYEPAIMPPTDLLINLIKEIQRRRVKVFLTLHSEPDTVKRLLDIVDGFIYHKPPTLIHSDNRKVNIIPMGVPVFDPTRSLSEARAFYGFKDTDKIITTTGFMFTWKQHANVLESMVPYLKADSNIKVQLLTSSNDINPYECIKENKNIKAVIERNNIENQVVHITDFLSQNELSERLWLSNLGYLWSDITTSSSSAAGKEFITSRLPLIATESSHYHDLISGVIKTPMDKGLFISKIFEILNHEDISHLYSELETTYNLLNYNDLIYRYIDIYKKD